MRGYLAGSSSSLCCSSFSCCHFLTGRQSIGFSGEPTTYDAYSLPYISLHSLFGTMETILYILGKIKVFLVGFFAGIVLHNFEMKTKNIRFNPWQFLWTGTMFGLITVFGNWVITGWFIEWHAPEEKILVLSLMVAVMVQFIIPFALKNPDKFTEFLLKRIGVKLGDNDNPDKNNS